MLQDAAKRASSRPLQVWGVFLLVAGVLGHFAIGALAALVAFTGALLIVVGARPGKQA